MIFDDLHNRYGVHIARRVQQELAPVEFDEVSLDDLPGWLETRAEIIHKEYQARLDNPFINEESGAARGNNADVLYRRWQAAEELAYLVTVAEDVNVQARVSAGSRK